MPLTLEHAVPGGNLYVRGTHHGVYVKRTTGTRDRDLAMRILAKIASEINSSLGVLPELPMGIVERTKRPRPGHTYLYCIQSLDYVKVGLADDPNKRLMRLAVGNPHEMRGVETWELKKSSAFVFEAAVHRILAEYAVGREWFKTTPEAVRAAVEQHNSTFDPPSEFSERSQKEQRSSKTSRKWCSKCLDWWYTETKSSICPHYDDAQPAPDAPSERFGDGTKDGTENGERE